MPLQYVVSIRNKKKLIDNSHLFVKERTSGEKTIWKCDQFYKIKCHARVYTNEDCITKRLGEHNHAGNIARVEAAKVINEIKEKAITTQETTHSIAAQAYAGISQAVAGQLPTPQYLKRNIRNARNVAAQVLANANPVCLLQLSIPPEYRITHPTTKCFHHSLTVMQPFLAALRENHWKNMSYRYLHNVIQDGVPRIGIIGGSGLNKLDILENKSTKDVTTPFGKPSESLVTGTINNVECVILVRHGTKHTIMPSSVNYRANIHALKEEGCTHILATTACGSLQEHIAPGDIVILDQFIDRTTKRIQTFYDGSDGAPKGVCHMAMHTPFCAKLSKILIETATKLGFKTHPTGTVVTIEGPRFSSTAESKMFQLWGGHVINMTTVPEVVLAKEAGISYASMALVTDYDSWREGEEGVSVDVVLKIFKENAKKAETVLKNVISEIASHNWTELIQHNKEAVMNSVLSYT